MGSDTGAVSQRMRKNFDNVGAHYDLSDEFFGLFLDPSRIYSCAYFESDDATLEVAQYAKVDLHLDRLGLEPGMTVLDIGCGWGATLKRAVECYDVNVVGLTLSHNQHAATTQLLDQLDTHRSRRVLLRGWEEFNEPVDRILSIEAFEHFGFERYDEFFEKCFAILPDDGRMTIQSSISYHPDEFRARGIPLSIDVLKFIKFMVTEIFPGARLPSSQMMRKHGEAAGFTVDDATSLRTHYVKTLGMWADALEANRAAALEVQSEEVYDRYMKYLRGCQEKFADEYIDVRLVTYAKPTG
ncbi:cyclopropane mycolic acid synthase family methyltransferase [Mycobacterium deserti]|uniref:Cyclopropane mycolic acid synthase family methyltransferase n=1 Tax=Mycobacterium deserti TaxID=2978347 RepID=A0ABT2M9H5_9MYCO|nr:cyclopropane mycolic acid synthase family methyltransferase [Mycobacterium deserti]MCT7658269.1 cyclopropane mycolic acid synthase family methyltransferase [Mycobacterium deserti]